MDSPWGFKKVVQKAWDTHVTGCGMFRLATNLLKVELKQLHRMSFTNITRRVDEVKEQLERLQKNLENDFTEQNHLVMQQGVRKLKRLLAVEDMYFHQLARDRWCTGTDRNVSYFHVVVKVSQRRTRIISLVTDEETRFTSPQEISS
ncbi:hypothetical protein Droror1_Dr00024433 [Drosera rotundifolia]